MSNKTIFEMMAQPSPPAHPVLTMPMAFAERIESLLSDLAPLSSEYVELRAMINAPLPELWAIHSVGPGEEWPMLSREDAEKAAEETADRCQSLMGGVRPEINVIPSPWEPAEHFEIAAQEAMEESERLRQGWKHDIGRMTGLRAFANALVTSALDGGDADGAHVQELAEKHGLIKKVTAHRPCVEPGDEKRFCSCASETSFPTECYTRTKALTDGDNEKSEG